MCILRPTRVQAQLFGKARVRMDSKGTASSKANDRLVCFDSFRLKRIAKRSLHLHLQKGIKSLIKGKLIFHLLCKKAIEQYEKESFIFEIMYNLKAKNI